MGVQTQIYGVPCGQRKQQRGQRWLLCVVFKLCFIYRCLESFNITLDPIIVNYFDIPCHLKSKRPPSPFVTTNGHVWPCLVKPSIARFPVNPPPHHSRYLHANDIKLWCILWYMHIFVLQKMNSLYPGWYIRFSELMNNVYCGTLLCWASNQTVIKMSSIHKSEYDTLFEIPTVKWIVLKNYLTNDHG